MLKFFESRATYAPRRSYPLAALSLAFSLYGVPASGQHADVFEATIPELQTAMDRGQLAAVDLVDAYLARIAAYDEAGPELNAILHLNPNARVEAAALDRERAEQGPRGPLHGIPVILKDNFNTAGLPTTGGSVALAGLVPPDDAVQVQRLREAGAIILAKANLHELAAGITTLSSLGGQTRNPYDPRRNPGGSSGGTAAAVAASFGAVGWGTDTCGSIRIPAAFNSLFGLRPSKGLSSIDGVIPLSHTQDVAGPLARTVTDLAIALDATVGWGLAATSLLGRPGPRFISALDTTALQGVRIGVLRSYFGDAHEAREVNVAIGTALKELEAQGAVVLDIELPGLDSLLEGTSVIDYEFKWDLMDYLASVPGAPVESLSEILDQRLHHEELEARFRVRNRPETRESEEYRKALAHRGVVREFVLARMEAMSLDALAYPTMRRVAALIGEPPLGGNCQLSATTDMPALSIPAGFTDEGLPVGLELLGRPFTDTLLLGIGYDYEQAVHPRRPPPYTPALVNGQTPDPIRFEVTVTGAELDPSAESTARARARLRFDPVLQTLDYTLEVVGVPAAQVHAVTLHRGGRGEVGPVLHRLLGRGQTEGEGTIVLGHTLRSALEQGNLYLQLYTRKHPSGAARGQLSRSARF